MQLDLFAKLKKCKKCSKDKPEYEFREEKRTKIGLQSRCKSCESAYASKPEQREKRRIHSEKIRKTPERVEYLREYFENPEKMARKRKNDANWRRRNPEKTKEMGKRWRDENVDRKKEMDAKWRSMNHSAKNASLAKYRATKAKATPAWADHQKIKEIYRKANELGMQVDHIIPLHGKKVCGLHVHNNLQLLSKSENCSKGNKWEIG